MVDPDKRAASSFSIFMYAYVSVSVFFVRKTVVTKLFSSSLLNVGCCG